MLLQRFATKRKIDRFKELVQDGRISVSPIPVHPSKRDRGLAIYLDLSRSLNKYLPKILGILKSLRKGITTILQFSNKVEETSFETLLKGNIQTTFGTDFNCVAQSILERGRDKVVIITDGYTSMSGELKQQLKKRGLVTLTILFDDAQTCQDLAQFMEVLPLQDICE